MDEILAVVQGQISIPTSDADFVSTCERFNNTERCARSGSKDCLSGVHKTAVSAIASASKRWRVAACKSPETRKRYDKPIRCAIKKGPEVTIIFQNHTGIMQGIRDLPIAPEEKLVKMCCVLNALDRELEKSYNRECPQSMPEILSIIHALTDDARKTLCVNPKCSGALDGAKGRKYEGGQNFLEPILQILFQLSTD